MDRLQARVVKSRIQTILHYWFGDESVDRNSCPSNETFHKWFGLSHENDAYIIEHFKEDLEKLASGHYEQWKQDRYGKLAAVILIDQFTKHIYRRSKEAFNYDHIAMDIVKSMTNEELFSYQF